MPDSTPSLYDQDFYAWANQQAGLLRSGQLSAARETGLAETAFPATCPWSFDQIGNDFWPEA